MPEPDIPPLDPLDSSEGDVLVVVRLDRRARSVSHFLQVIEELEQKGAHFRSLRYPIDTSTPQGMFSCKFWVPSPSSSAR